MIDNLNSHDHTVKFVTLHLESSQWYDLAYEHTDSLTRRAYYLRRAEYLDMLAYAHINQLPAHLFNAALNYYNQIYTFWKQNGRSLEGYAI